MDREVKVSIKQKLLWAYAVFALLPMFIITIYTYYSTRDILIEQLDAQLTQKLERDVRMIDEKIGRLYYVSNSLFTDDVLYNYLTVDYSEKGFEDLYYYVQAQLSRIKILYPEIEQLMLYTTNSTLPEDKLYFYYLEEEDVDDWYGYTGRNGEEFQAAVLDEGRLSFIRRMNLYESGGIDIFLRMDIKSSELGSIIQNTSTGSSFLCDRQGNVLVVGGEEEELAGQEGDWIKLSQETKYCGILTNLENVRVQQRQAGRSASKVFFVFLAASVLAFTVIYFFSSYFQKSIQRIIAGAREIGAGNLTYRIPVPSADELGQVTMEINQLGEKLDILIEDSYKKEIARKDSELNLLQEQINPHFLYNALSSISSLARRNRDGDTFKAIQSLADFYRISLNKGKRIIKVQEEINLLESYLAVQRFRFGDSICVDYELDDALLDKEIIKLILQPVVENAIHHGRYDDEENFHISIRLFSQGDCMVFTVSDDGRGIETEELLKLQESMEQAQDGMGLRNVNARIKLQYGVRYGVSLESQPDLGTIVQIKLPADGA
ncbi:MAG: sensor histidine kinase [Lachnospiraceae bacterium]|nr:sensor histidine kinase [Lachnospiraceae bacterium]